jgi:pentose-5-phosphate-3-epimerase
MKKKLIDPSIVALDFAKLGDEVASCDTVAVGEV